MCNHVICFTCVFSLCSLVLPAGLGTSTAVGEGEVSEMEAMRAALDDKRTRYEVWRRYTEFELLKHFLGTVYPYVSEEDRGKEGRGRRREGE